MNLKLFAAGAAAALGLGVSALPAQAYILGYSYFAGAQLSLCTLGGDCTLLWTQAPAYDGYGNVTMASGSGWYNSAGQHDAGNDDYIVADPGDPGLTAFGDYNGYHNFLVFALGDLPDQIVSASITLHQGGDGTLNSGASAPAWLRLGSFFGDLADLESGAGGVSDYDALGGGQAFGYHHFTGADDNSDVTFDLNDDFVDLVNAADSGSIAMGGRIATRLEATGVIPEPTTWSMMILGFLGAGSSLRNRRRALAGA